MKRFLSILLATMLVAALGLVPAALAKESVTEYPALGLKLSLTEDETSLGISAVVQDETLLVVYTGEDGTSIVVAAVYVFSEADYTQVVTDGEFIAFVEKNKISKIGENEGNVYLLSSMADFDKLEDYFVDALADEGTKLLLTPHLDKLAEVKAVLPAITDSIQFIPVEAPEVTVPEFVAQDIYGNEYTNELFASKDLTVINIWGTFCGPCVNEMPELGEWSKSMPENVQIIGLVSDIYSADDASTMDTARQIVEATGADFPHLIPGPGLADLLNISPYVPTTIFVDSQGHMVGEPVIGAYVAQYKAFVEEYLSGMEK